MPGPFDANDPAYADNPRAIFKNGMWQAASKEEIAASLARATDPNDRRHVGAYDPNDPTLRNNPNAVFTEGVWSYRAAGDKQPGEKANDFARAPGAQLDTAQSQEDAQRLAPLIEQLRQQAATGGGAWEKSLQQATQRASANAMSLGQSQTGQSAGDELRNISNGQAAAAQQGGNVGNILRAQSQQNASSQLAGILGQQGGLEAQQAGSNQAVHQGVRSAQDAYMQQVKQEQNNTLSGLGQAALSLMSDGGPVPGKPQTFGDNETNDTVPAMLSPGEVVLPRSVTQSPDAPEQAAAFVRAVQSQNGGLAKHHFDTGGAVPPPWKPGDHDVTAGGGDPSWNPLQPNPNDNAFGLKRAAPTIQNGGILDTAAYDSNRNAVFNNSAALQQAGAGMGPSVAPQMMQSSSDAALVNAIRQQQGGRAPAGDALLGAVNNGLEGGAKAAETAQGEQQRGSDAFAQAMLQQRARDLGIAQAQQQAGWRNSMMNQGISLQNQAAMRNIFAGAGQAAMGASDALGKFDFGGKTNADAALAADRPPMMSDESEWNPYPGGGVDSSSVGDWNTGAISDDGFAAHGGVAVEDERTRNFLAALRRSA